MISVGDLRRGIVIELDGDLWQMAHFGHAELSDHVENVRDVGTVDALLLRVILALLGYLHQTKHPKRVRYTDVKNDVQHAIREYLDLCLTTRFHAQLPDRADQTGLGDLEKLSRPSWELFVKKERR